VFEKMKLNEIGFYTLSDERCFTLSEKTPLMRCELILTDACNFRCGYCRGQKKELKKNLKLQEAKEIVDLWVSEGLKNVRFSGGEPTIWNGIVELVKYTKERNVERIAISSNGSASLKMYDDLIEAGVNDFSISLDACCASYGDLMAGNISGAWEKVIECIKHVSKKVYTTVGIVVTEDTVHQLKETVMFAANLGVQDIRIISAAQFNKMLNVAESIPKEVYEKYPILKYRINNLFNGLNVRGIKETDSKKCGIALDDMVVAGDHHFPCVIYMREQGNPIGKVGSNMRQERFDWVKNHNTHEDPICKTNCLDCLVLFNKKLEDNNPVFQRLS
jgi:MoaA/NifB/PqqE/SkfB family radical SAM enzyme